MYSTIYLYINIYIHTNPKLVQYIIQYQIAKLDTLDSKIHRCYVL